MLHKIEDHILALIELQFTISEIIAAGPTAEFDPLWGRGYVSGAHFTRMILAGLNLAEARTTGPLPVLELNPSS
jgi:hypothetical protein